MVFFPLGQDTPCGMYVGILRRWENGWGDGIMIWWTTSGEEKNFQVTSINGSNLIYPPMSGYDEAVKSLALLAASWWKHQQQSLKTRLKKHFVTWKEATAEALRIQVSSRGRNSRNTKVLSERKGQQRHSGKKIKWMESLRLWSHSWMRTDIGQIWKWRHFVPRIQSKIFLI